MKRIIFLAMILFVSLSVIAFAKVQTEEVTYKGDGLTMKGYLVYDDAIKEKRPGVLVVHEWWGHNEYVRKRARMLAELGFTALAVDMFGDGKNTIHPADAKKFTEEVDKNAESARKRFMAAYEVLKAHKTTDPNRIAAMGYCFGGSTVLDMARQGVDLDGVVSFHGGLSTKTPAKPGVVKAKVLVCHGADDSFIPPADIEAFKKEMKDAGVDMQFISYPGAKHSFTNADADEIGKKANIPIAYNAEADKKSWADMQAFLKKIF